MSHDTGEMKNSYSTAGSGQLTTAPVTVPAVTVLQRDPEFVRLPKPGQLCPFSALTRSKLNELVLPNALNHHRPPVKSICLRQQGATTGIRLVVFRSLLDYLHKQGDEQPVHIPRSKKGNGAG